MVRIGHRRVTIQWKAAIHRKPSAPKIQNGSTSGTKIDSMLVPNKGLQLLPQQNSYKLNTAKSFLVFWTKFEIHYSPRFLHISNDKI